MHPAAAEASTAAAAEEAFTAVVAEASKAGVAAWDTPAEWAAADTPDTDFAHLSIEKPVILLPAFRFPVVSCGYSGRRRSR